MNTPYDAVLKTKYNKLIQLIEKYNLLDLWDDTLEDTREMIGNKDLDINQLINLAESLLNKNLKLNLDYHLQGN